MYDNQSEESRCRSDTGRADHGNYRTCLFVYLSHASHFNYRVAHGHSGDCSDREHDCRA